jgi:hypothetical protein
MGHSTTPGFDADENIKEKEARAAGEPFGPTGFEAEELAGAFQKEVLTGPFGTKESPVIVPSIFDMRIVGCEGTRLVFPVLPAVSPPPLSLPPSTAASPISPFLHPRVRRLFDSVFAFTKTLLFLER